MNVSFPRAVASLSLMLLFAPVSHAAGQRTTLRSKDVPYSAKITLQDAGLDKNGKRLLAYRMDLASHTCKSSIAGNVRFFATTDSMQDDSAFLQNGEVVKTHVFKDDSAGSEVTLTVDVESRRPRYVGVSLKGAPVVAGGCFERPDVSYDFFSW